jgi:hypothetical protein
VTDGEKPAVAALKLLAAALISTAIGVIVRRASPIATVRIGDMGDMGDMGEKRIGVWLPSVEFFLSERALPLRVRRGNGVCLSVACHVTRKF